MKIEQLVEQLKNNGTLTVKFNSVKGIFEDTYIEKGMICNISYIGIDECSYYKLIFDYNGFDKDNEPFESHDWYITSRGPTGTMKEAGMYPKNGKEEIYLDFGIDLDIEILNANGLYTEYLESKEDISYVKWLENTLVSIHQVN